MFRPCRDVVAGMVSRFVENGFLIRPIFDMNPPGYSPPRRGAEATAGWIFTCGQMMDFDTLGPPITVTVINRNTFS